MTGITDSPSCSCYFETQHEQHSHPAMRALEKRVLGCDFGGTSWTTKTQAEKIPAALKLASTTNLLEIGAGTGWPGIYLAKQTGARVTLLDLPANSLSQAHQRAVDENVGNRCLPVSANGSALPFQDGAFEAVSHSDVLCCLPEKLDMLMECRRVVREGARMLFYVIAPARGLSGPSHQQACEVGPPFVDVADDYARLLIKSGWKVLEMTDLTTEYLLALRRFVICLEADAATLKDVLGEEEYKRQLQLRKQQAKAIERGLLEREVYLVKAI